MSLNTMNYQVDLSVACYASDRTNIALMLTIADGEEAGEEFCDLTVNLGADIGNGTVMPRSCGFVNVHDFPGAEKFITENGLGEPYTRFGETVCAYSGFVTFPLYRFDEKRLAELDPKGFELYAQQYGEAFEQALDCVRPFYESAPAMRI